MREGARGGTTGSLAVQHTPGPVEDEDPPGEELLELFADVLHDVGSRLRGREPEKALGLFRRLVTRSPSCRSKLSGECSG
jgi:hypothetical protein